MAKKVRKARIMLNKRTAEQREIDILFCTRLFLQNVPYREMAKLLNEHNADRGFDYTISFQQIAWDMKELMQEWRDENKSNIDASVTKDLLKLEVIERECWQEWHKSKEDFVRTEIYDGKVSEGSREVTGGKVGRLVQETKGGDAKYFDTALKAMERRARLLGYDTPTKMDVTTGGEKITSELQLPEDVLLRVASAIFEGEQAEKDKEQG